MFLFSRQRTAYEMRISDGSSDVCSSDHAALVVMFWTRWQVTLAILVLAPPLAWVMDKVGKRYRRVSHRIQESSADLMQSADQSLSNNQEVKVYGARGVEFERYSALADRHMRLSLKVESTRSISSAMVQLMGS